MVLAETVVKEGATSPVTGHGSCGLFGMVTSDLARRGSVAALSVATLFSAHAVVFYGTGDPTHNTTAPAGALADSGWQWQGIWGGLLGTAIAPGYFVTAAHVGGGTGQVFYLNLTQRNYLTVASYLAPNADLRIWQVADTFPSFAPRYTGSAERSKGVVVFGRGGERGEAVVVDGLLGPETKGWLWSSANTATRWGTNTVATIVDASGLNVTGRGALPGDLLRLTFDASGGADEVILSVGDSGGGIFLLDNGVWKLAGINHAVESSYRLTATGADFSAAIYDRGGLYNQTSAGYVLVPDQPANQPAAFYGVRIAGSESWIASVLAGQVTPERVMAVESATAPQGPYADEPAAQLQAAASQFLVPITGQARFYRLRSDYGINISSVAGTGGNIVLRFGP